MKAKLYNLLRWSEKYTKTDMVYLAKGGFWLTLGNILLSLIALLSAMAFAHFLPKELYGNYKFIFTLAGLFGAISLTGLAGAITNAAARGKTGTLVYSFKKNIEWSLPMVLIFFLSAFYYVLRENYQIGYSLLVVGIFTPFLNSSSLSDSLLMGQKNFKWSTLSTIIVTSVTTLLTIITVVFTQNIFLIVTVNISSTTLFRYFIYRITVEKLVEKEEVDKQVVNYGAHLSVIGIINSILDKIDAVLTFHFLGATPLAIYTFAVAIPEQIKGLFKSLSYLALPKYAQKKIPYSFAERKILSITLIVTPIIILYIFMAPYIFKFLFPSYSDTSVFISQIYSLSLLTIGAIIPVTYLQAIEAKRELYLYNMVGGVSQILLVTVGIIYYGLMGLVLSIIFGRALRFIYALYLARQVTTD